MRNQNYNEFCRARARDHAPVTILAGALLVYALVLSGCDESGSEPGQSSAERARLAAATHKPGLGASIPTGAAALPTFVTELADFEALRDLFNSDRGKVRVAVLVEPG